MTAVRDVPVGGGEERGRESRREEGEGKNEGRKGERERRRDGGREKHSLLHHKDTTGFLLHGKVGDDRAVSISHAPL